jgi:lysozyme family protein
MALHTHVIHVIQKLEGGLSYAQSDNAKYHPSPYKEPSGNYYYHTNKGVTWAAFVANAPLCKYDVNSYDNFMNMPESIWGCIFKRSYWNQINGDLIESQAIADYAAQFAWNAGATAAGKTIQNVINEHFAYSILTSPKSAPNSKGRLAADGAIGAKTLDAINRIPPRELLDQYAIARKAYYNSLPNQEANRAGWAYMMNTMYYFCLDNLNGKN